MTRPLVVGVVCLPGMGGSSVVAVELAAGLAGRGHEVHVLAAAPPVRDRLPGPSPTFHEVQVPDFPIFAAPPLDQALASRIIDVASQERFDVLHVHYAVPHAAAGLLARQALGDRAFRLVTSLHGTDVTRVGSDPALRSLTSFAIAASDAVTVPSAWLRDEAHARLSLPAGLPIEVMPNFVDAARFAPPLRRDRGRFDALLPHDRGAPVLFHVSNFREVKRAPDLLEVLARVRRRMPARLVCVGEGPELPAAQARAAELGLSGSVCFLGNRTDFAAELRHADAFLLTSETESFGVAALEALSSGVPVCAYRVGGLPEVVAPGTGRLAAPFDADDLAAAVCEVIGDPATREHLGAAAREHVLARYRLEPALARWEALLTRLVERGRSREAS